MPWSYFQATPAQTPHQRERELRHTRFVLSASTLALFALGACGPVGAARTAVGTTVSAGKSAVKTTVRVGRTATRAVTPGCRRSLRGAGECPDD